MDTKITATEVREWRKNNGWTLSELGAALGGLTTSQVSKLETGSRPIAPAEQTLLQILIWNKLPEKFPGWEDLGADRLEFSAMEWELITNIARRRGLSPQEWIAFKIREYLEVYDLPVSLAKAKVDYAKIMPSPEELANDQALVAERATSAGPSATGLPAGA